MGQIQVQYNVNNIEGLCVITPAIHGDSRGYFMETYNENDMREAGLNYNFVQDNQSSSSKGVLDPWNRVRCSGGSPGRISDLWKAPWRNPFG